jgi:hypothetical protein
LQNESALIRLQFTNLAKRVSDSKVQKDKVYHVVLSNDVSAKHKLLISIEVHSMLLAKLCNFLHFCGRSVTKLGGKIQLKFSIQVHDCSRCRLVTNITQFLVYLHEGSKYNFQRK